MWPGEIWRRIRSALRPGAREPELDSELRFHLEMETEQNKHRGMDPGEAARIAERDFGSRSQIKEEAREARGFPWLSELFRDFRLSARSLRRTPGFTFVAVLTLGLGIGSTTAIFSVVDAVLLRALPFAHPEQLAIVRSKVRDQPNTWNITYRDFQSWQEAGVFDKVAAYQGTQLDVSGSGNPFRANAFVVSRDFFQVLGTAPRLGRFFVADDFTPAGPVPAIISYSQWQRMGGGTELIGSTIKVTGVVATIVGVAGPGESWPVDADLWIARRSPVTDNDLAPDNYVYEAVARLKPNTTFQTTDGRLDLLARDQESAFPAKRRDVTVTVLPLREFLVGPALSRSLLVMLGAVGLVLLIACVNLANLLLARTTRRYPELALRAALGASRGRITRHLLAESILVAVPGGVAGVLLAVAGVRTLQRLAPPDVPGLGNASVNAPVMLVGLAAALLAVLVGGLTPALHGGALVRSPGLGESGARTTAGGRSTRLRSVLVVAEVSLSLTLLAGAALLIRSFLNLQHVAPGLEVRSAVTFEATYPRAQNPANASVLRFWDQFLERLRALDGVEAVGGATSIPLGGGGFYLGRTLIEAGKPEPPAGPEVDVMWNVITPGYFGALRQPVLAGRDFTVQDDSLAPAVIIVSQSLAKALFPRGNALGGRIFSWRDERIEREIVGIVGDVRFLGLAEAAGPLVYIPHGQYAASRLGVILRGRGSPADLLARSRHELGALNPGIAMARPRTLEQVKAESIARPRFLSLLIGVFSGTALVLAAIGLSGLLSYSVAQRDRELSIRIALGASRGQIVGLVLRQTLLLAGLGIGLGVAGALALTGVLRSLLFGVSPTDPVAFVAVAVLLLVTALLASALPARRAVRSDPLATMRTE